jgi:single-strand DNA-binding protein
MLPVTPMPDQWPKPPSCLPHNRLAEPHNGARVCVAGLVLVRQRPGTAHGVVFITLEDETGVSNIIVWKDRFKKFRRAVIAGRLLRVTGKLQREAGVCHIIAEHIEDISYMLDDLLRPESLSQGQG